MTLSSRLPRPHLDPEVADGLKRGLLIGTAIAALVLPPAGIATVRVHPGWQAPAVAAQAPWQPQAPRFADFGEVEPPVDVRRIADWATDSRDNRGMDFVVLDKRGAHVYIFDAGGRLRADTPVLLGEAAGDLTAEGVGERAQSGLHQVNAEEKTTPAGRFVGQSGMNAHGEDVFWVDYHAAVSMHRVKDVEASDRRLERLATPTPEDNRISYGCINMPVAFFDEIMSPTFKGKRGMVYVLPETMGFDEIFPMVYDVASRHGLPARPQT